jgi:hypothetical protein
MKARRSICLMLGIALLAFGCGKSEQQKKSEETAKKLEEAGKSLAEAGERMKQELQKGQEDVAEAMKKMGKAITGGREIEPVNPEDLKTLLPANLPGMIGGEPTGERNEAFGINVSEVEEDYETEDGSSSIDIKITDMGSIRSLTAMTAFAWIAGDYSHETETGYEKSTRFSGHKAFEEYNRTDRSGKMQVLVADRFIVEVNGYNVRIEAVKEALGRIDLGKLSSWKDFGVEK